MSETMAQRITKAREKKGLGLRALAREAKISSAYLSLIESGQRNPTIKTMQKIAKALGVTPAHLTFGG